jgi:hypothetical protein
MAKPQATSGTCAKMKPTAPAATVETSSGQSRLTITAAGRCSGSIVASFASARSRPIGAVTCARRPKRAPMSDAATHQPAPTSTSASSRSPVAAMTVMIASIVAAAALSMTVVLSRSTKRTGGYAANADSSVRTPTGPSTSTSAWVSSSAGVSSEATPTQTANSRRPSAASRRSASNASRSVLSSPT